MTDPEPWVILGLALLTAALFASAEVWLILRGTSLSDKIRALYRRQPHIGFLVGLGSGLLLAHLFFC